jgi:2-phospho-L-lactate guanylyltransferase
MARVILPLKDLVEAKSRLSGLLRPAERRSLAQAMVEDVLSTLAGHPQINAVTLVSDDPVSALLASNYGIEHMPEAALGCRGLNPVIAKASQLLSQRSEQPIIVLHGDLPCLTEDDISAALNVLKENSGLVIGCDRHGLGTNLLAFHTDNQPEFSFGTGSCARHRMWAEKKQIPVHILQRAGIGLDIDEPQDLGFLLPCLPKLEQSHCAQLLVASELGSRVRTQLTSMGLLQGEVSREKHSSEGVGTS